MTASDTATLATPVRYQLRIGATWKDADSGRTFDSINPYTGAVWAQVPDGGPADIDQAVVAARAAFEGPWGSMTGGDRARLLRRLAQILERDAEPLAAIETRDNGKLLREMSGQMAALPEWFTFHAGSADKLHGDAISSSTRPNFFAYTRHEPVGVVGAITPWNSPLLLLAWKLAPALAAGCTMVVKPSEHTPASTLELVSRLDEAGFPPGVLNVVTGFGPSAGMALASHPGIDKMAFTGSTAVGVEVGRAAMANLTRCSLELGGKSAQLVFSDADIDDAVNGIMAGVFAATGQTCMAGSRLIVHERVHDAVVARLTERSRSIVLGDPADPATQMGPLATAAQHAKVTEHIDRALAEGARLAGAPSGRPAPGGFFVPPTVLCDVDPGMRIASEEVFGPVLAVMRFRSEQEAIALANATRFGLAGGVWTLDVRRAHRVAHRLRAGTVWINAYRVVGPDVPFGGFGSSGIGRENGVDAIKEFTETKAIWVELSGATRDPFTLG